MTPCQQAEALIERRVDGLASVEEDRRLDAHVAGCAACAALLHAETALDAALADRFAHAEPSAALTVRIRERTRAEAPPGRAWIPDLLNVAGLLVCGAGVLPLVGGAAGGVGRVLGMVLGLAALVAGLSPLLLAGAAGEAGSGEPDLAP